LETQQTEITKIEESLNYCNRILQFTYERDEN